MKLIPVAPRTGPLPAGFAHMAFELITRARRGPLARRLLYSCRSGKRDRARFTRLRSTPTRSRQPFRRRIAGTNRARSLFTSAPRATAEEPGNAIMRNRILRLWCRAFHRGAMWPVHGKYICPRCLREWAVCWESQNGGYQLPVAVALPLSGSADSSTYLTRARRSTGRKGFSKKWTSVGEIP